MNRRASPTVYFLGAGASAADGLPITRELNFAIAAYLSTARGRASRLARYYKELYGVRPKDLVSADAAWQKYCGGESKRLCAVDKLPDLIETLSIIDLSLSEEYSLGASTDSHGRVREEFDKSALLEVRMELAMALGLGIQDVMYRRRAPLVAALVRKALNETSSTFITTNWDTLIDRALIRHHRRTKGDGWLTSCNIDYGCVDERIVDWRGNDITRRANPSIPLLKIHGSLNWFFCPCCSNLYANVQGSWIIDPQRRRLDFDDCHCRSGLQNLMVAPSYVKNYRNPHLMSVWRKAQKALESARHWVFVGYSLPTDDLHIRAMLLRSFRTNLASHRSRSIEIKVITRDESGDLKARYRGLFRLAKPDFVCGGLEQYLS